jgi:hypothetical protein
VRGADECVAVQIGIVDGSQNQPLEDGCGCLHAVGDLAWTEVREPSRGCLDEAIAGGRIRRMELFRNPRMRAASARISRRRGPPCPDRDGAPQSPRADPVNQVFRGPLHLEVAFDRIA